MLGNNDLIIEEMNNLNDSNEYNDDVVCDGSACLKRSRCKFYYENYWKWHDSSKWAQSIDWSKHGWGSLSDNGCEYGWNCGDLSDGYPIFEEME